MLLKKIIKRAIQIGLILIASLVLVEALMIFLDPYLFKDRFEYDPDLGFRARAYFPTDPAFHGPSDEGSTTNRFGFNDRDYPLTRQPGVFRILVVGDSFSWAGGLHNNYTALLEELFERRDGSHKIDVVNTGYPGTHTGEQLAMLKKFGLQYNPDLVILGFFAGNDFIEGDPNRKRIVVNKYFFDIDKRHEHRFLGFPIIMRSRLRLFLQHKSDAYRLENQARAEGAEWAAATGQPTPVRNLPEATFYSVQRGKLELFDKRTSGERFGANIRYIFESISEMNELLKSKGIKFMVAIFPDELQVNPNQFNSLTERFRLKKEDYDLNLAQDLLKSDLASKQIPFLDMLERFRAEEKQRELYLWRNTHWNQAGNELAAEMLFQYLIKQPYDFNSPQPNP